MKIKDISGRERDWFYFIIAKNMSFIFLFKKKKEKNVGTTFVKEILSFFNVHVELCSVGISALQRHIAEAIKKLKKRKEKQKEEGASKRIVFDYQK